ncbi:hypothetical protein ACE6H2_000952 [Prunus campanulata]
MSTLIRNQDVVVDVIELSFRGQLVLMPREHAGILVIIHARRASGTKMDRVIKVVLMIDLGSLIPKIGMSMRTLSPLHPCHAVTKLWRQ